VKSTEKFTPNLRIVNSSSNVDCNSLSDFSFKIKPDVSVYCADSDPKVKTDSSLVEIFIEFKWSSGDDPFCDPYDVSCPHCGQGAKSFLHETTQANDTLGQITAYTATQLGAQYHTHVYSVFIMKGTAQLLRWDRSGTIVTEAINYNESPLLAEFFRCYSVAPPAMRGKDQSVSDPTPIEAIEARKALGLDNKVPLVKLQIPGAHDSLHYYITSAPRTTSYTPPGHATRGGPAYNILQRTKVFLKDSWRVDLPDIQAKGLTYKTLMDAKVRNIPQCLTSGDISTAEYHATKTQSFTSQPCACRPRTHFVPHRHYHLALDVIGRSLTAFESSYEMVTTVRDGVIGELPHS
ncbi:hypothetical protein PILCRDRAFT_70424, partial [Piloderma croceum F 1598]